jgi:hypothetical protein
VSDDGAIWHPAGKTFLFPKTALATLARARFRDAFARLCPTADLPELSPNFGDGLKNQAAAWA